MPSTNEFVLSDGTTFNDETASTDETTSSEWTTTSEDTTFIEETTFFDMPYEIREYIYCFAAYHSDTGGVISPLIERAYQNVAIALLDQRRYAVTHDHRYYKKSPRFPVTNTERRFYRTSNAVSNHFCTPKCLKPDGLSEACLQLRNEFLPVFYGVNRFHFEMSNSEITNANGFPTHRWSPVRWWRAIGDTNLRHIRAFSLVGHPTNDVTKDVNIMFLYRNIRSVAKAKVERIGLLGIEESKRAEVNNTLNRPPDRHPNDTTRFDVYRQQKWTRSSDFLTAVRPQARTMKESGLHVSALERLVAELEPWDAEYVKDHISLGDDLVVGNIGEGPGELALKYNPWADKFVSWTEYRALVESSRQDSLRWTTEDTHQYQ